VTFRGVLEGLHVAPTAAEPMQARGVVELVAGVGIMGDRYSSGQGTFSGRPHLDRQVTLIEAETLDALARDRGTVLEPHEHRRNMTTRGVPLNHLVGRYFAVGDCVLYGGRLNVPCAHLESLVGRPLVRQLLNRSGLNARVVVGGVVRCGDPIVPFDPADLAPALVAANEAHPVSPAPDVA
jgi:MOSC domain-containing protein YiiM